MFVGGRGDFVNVCAASPGQAASQKPVSSGPPSNEELRLREYLTVPEVERLMKAARTAATVTGTLPRSWLPSDMGCGLQRELCRRFIVMASGA